MNHTFPGAGTGQPFLSRCLSGPGANEPVSRLAEPAEPETWTVKVSQDGTVPVNANPCVAFCLVPVGVHALAPDNSTTLELTLVATWTKAPALCQKILVDVYQAWPIGGGQFDGVLVAHFEGLSPLTAELRNTTLVEAPDMLVRVGIRPASYEVGPAGPDAHEDVSYRLDASLNLRDVLDGDREAAKARKGPEPNQTAPGNLPGC